jgi:hypothetical protein
VIAARAFSNSACRLAGAAIATVWFVLKTIDAPVTVCGDVRDDSKWEDAKVIVSGLQMPFQAVDPSSARWRRSTTRRSSRPSRSRSTGCSTTCRATPTPRSVGRSRAPPGVFRSTIRRPEASDWDTLPFGLVTALSASSPLRRGLGLGFLDHFDLTPGETYDYRIRGKVPRADRDEARVDFHTVPRALRCPRASAWAMCCCT